MLHISERGVQLALKARPWTTVRLKTSDFKDMLHKTYNLYLCHSHVRYIYWLVSVKPYIKFEASKQASKNYLQRDSRPQILFKSNI